MTDAIAIVGMACRYADVTTPRELWENVLSGRRAFRRIPEKRLSLDDYYSTNLLSPDHINVKEAATIKDYHFDRVRYRVAGNTYRVTDLTHWLALDVAAQALQDAGFPEGKGLPLQKTGALVGNTLTGEFSRAGLMRIRWPYVQHTVDKQLHQKGWSQKERSEFLSTLEVAYKDPFPIPDEESLAGGLSNTIAGRLCNYFHLQGGGYTLDGACSSSLLAVTNACTALQNKDLDAALVGGVDLSLDPFELVGFSRTGALARNEMRVFDNNPTGFLPGEGCGFVLLMRHEDAMAQGLRCYSLIRGWGISSDGAGGITRPEISGQRLALDRAYLRAGYDINSVPLFEGHGTGTAIGDEVELQSLSLAINQKMTTPNDAAAIGSIKPLIGHTKAAAGIAGLIKTTMALHTQVIPPVVGVRNPRPEIAGKNAVLRAPKQPEQWPVEKALRAGVSSFGFGGINVHLTLENPASQRRHQLTPIEHQFRTTIQDKELLLFSANSKTELTEVINQVSNYASQLSYSELTDIAAALSSQSDSTHSYRAAIVTDSPTALSASLLQLKNYIDNDSFNIIDPENGLFLGKGSGYAKIAYLFPGQAAPVRLTGDIWAHRFPWIKEIFDNALNEEPENESSTATAQPSIIATELAGLKILNHLGVVAQAGLGHSLGELAALRWAGAMNDKELQTITRTRGHLMANVEVPPGAMASIGAHADIVEQWLQEYSTLTIACFNSPGQTIVSGELKAIDEITKKAQTQGIKAVRLPVSNAFHSPHMLSAAAEFEKELDTQKFSTLQQKVISTVTGKALTSNVKISNLLVTQLTEPVRFIQAQSNLPTDIDLCIEVGPGKILQGLYKEISTTPVISLDVAGSSLEGILLAAGACFCLGGPIKHQALFEDRFHRPFDLNWQASFFENPCELTPKTDLDTSLHLKAGNQPIETMPTETLPEKTLYTETNSPTVNTLPITDDSTSEKNIEATVCQLVATKLELPLESIKPDNRLLIDLHLNSISVGEIVANVATTLDLPVPVALTDFSNATVAEVAQAFEDIKKSGSQQNPAGEKILAGVDEWVKPFTVELIDQARPSPTTIPRMPEQAHSDWRVFAADDHPLKDALMHALQDMQTSGVLLCLPPKPAQTDIDILVQSAHSAIDPNNPVQHFVMVQHGGGAASVARSLFLETNNLNVSVIDTPPDNNATKRIIDEIRSAQGYLEVYYDHSGTRRIPRLVLLEPTETQNSYPLGNEDVLLVSGGGKGIAAECAFDLASQTGTKLAILGRSNPDEDSELSNNLKRFEQRGICFHYVSADVTNKQDIENAVSTFSSELGPVTAILHGAGINHPKLIRDLEQKDFQTTLTTKLGGAQNLVSTVGAENLRLFVTFSSIIARTGMQGEADYALANEWLSRYTDSIQKDNPACKCLAMEWSIWSGVGMGERLGRVDALQNQGIMPISVDRGIEIFHQLVSTPITHTSVVISSRLGKIPTLQLKDSPLPFYRFLEKKQIYYPNLELIVDSEISSGSDPYVLDHIYKQEALLPAVMGMEAMIQAAMAVTGKELTPKLEKLVFLQPIVIPTRQALTLRVAALVRSPSLVEVVLRTSTTQFSVDHFRGLCRFEPSAPEEVRTIDKPGQTLKLDIDRDIYDDLLFHKKRFRRITAYHRLTSTHCIAEIDDSHQYQWFSNFLPGKLVLGDPGIRDAAIHAIQACIPHSQLLPISVDSITFGDATLNGPFLVEAKEKEQQENTYIYDLEIRNYQGALKERWHRLKLRKVGDIKHQSWPEPLLLTYMERRIRELIPESHFGIALKTGDIDIRQAISNETMQQAIGDSIAIFRRPDGKPVTNSHHRVSSSHHGALTLAVASDDIATCDVEKVMLQTDQSLANLVGEDGTMLARLIATSTQEETNISTTRVWSAKECIKKAGASINTPLVLLTSHKDGWVLLGAGKYKIATYTTFLRDNTEALCFSILVEDKYANI